MEIDKSESDFTLTAETILDGAILEALTFLPYRSPRHNCLILHNNYYKKVVHFIVQIDDYFNDTLYELQKELNNADL